MQLTLVANEGRGKWLKSGHLLDFVLREDRRIADHHHGSRVKPTVEKCLSKEKALAMPCRFMTAKLTASV